MKIIEFLKKSIAGELSVPIQKKFLESDLQFSAKELALVVQFLRRQIPHKLQLKNAIDVCGTGGSGLVRINTSTISALILSSKFGIGVAKHGNNAASGGFGSFDLIRSLGINFSDKISEIEKKYQKENLAFLFAPFFHPVMKHFSEARKKIGKPTIFNLLGPLLNPAFPKRQIIGTAFKEKMNLIAETCRLLGMEKVYAVHGEDGLDEVTVTGRTFVSELSDGKISSYTISPTDFGISKANFTEIMGGDEKFNTKIAQDIIEGKCKSRHRDLVLVNVALALKLTGKANTLKEGYDLALEKISRRSILEKIVDQKKLEVEMRKRNKPIRNIQPSVRNFMDAIKQKGIALIAEIKKASPSEGLIEKNRFSPSKMAKNYENFGACAISIVCDRKFFHGDLRHLKNVAEKTVRTPILCKDFIIDEYQIYEARKNGADAILLIASILTAAQIENFLKVAASLNMAAVSEVHNLTDLKKILKTEAKIIGINNRDLNSFNVDIGITLKLLKHIPKGKLIISESGFLTKEDVAKVRGKVDAILVGTSLMKGKKIEDLMGKQLKICGIRNINEAKFCERLGVDFIGLNFVPASRRFISVKQAISIRNAVNKIAVVGVFANQSLSKVNGIAKKLNLDYIQLSGDESLDFVRKCLRPVIKTIVVKALEDLKMARQFLPHAKYILLDGGTPGSGEPIRVKLKNLGFPFIIAGGISPSNVKKIVKNLNPIGVDVATGVETNGKIDLGKIRLVHKNLHLA